jgi:hypothetical protein
MVLAVGREDQWRIGLVFLTSLGDAVRNGLGGSRWSYVINGKNVWESTFRLIVA